MEVISLEYLPNRMHCLLAKQKCRCEILVSQDAWYKGWVVHILRQVVPMNISNDPPDDAETKPRKNKAGSEGEENVSPLHINHGSEYILFQRLIEWYRMYESLNLHKSSILLTDPIQFCVAIPRLWYNPSSLATFSWLQNIIVLLYMVNL